MEMWALRRAVMENSGGGLHTHIKGFQLRLRSSKQFRKTIVIRARKENVKWTLMPLKSFVWDGGGKLCRNFRFSIKGP